MRVFGICVIVVVVFSTTRAAARVPSLLEMKTKHKTYRGKLVATDHDRCWLMDRDGRLHQLALKQVREHRAISPRFRRYTAGELRDRLRREFGGAYEVVGSEHYLVCAKRGEARQYADVFENVFRSFHRYFSTRQLKISRPEFPLVALVFPDHAGFARYCHEDGLKAFPGLRGYYLRTSNRIALYAGRRPPERRFVSQAGNNVARDFTLDSGCRRHIPANAGRPRVAVTSGDRFAELFGPHDSVKPPLMRTGTFFHPQAKIQWEGSIQASLKETLIHEATHQIAFNTALHSRIGETPKWVVEGLATVFESPGIRNSSGRQAAKTRINRERYLWFGRFAQTQRKRKSLSTFVSSDKMFSRSPLDAYSQAWALSFYLIETRPSMYARYLKNMAERDPLKPYTSRQRVADFKSAFGKDLDWLEVDFLRFIERLK